MALNIGSLVAHLKVGGANQFKRDMGMAGKAVTKIAGAFGAAEIARRSFNLAKSAAEAADAAKIFEQAGGKIDRLRKSVRGTVSDFELIKKANLARTMGIPEEAFGKLARAAMAASKSTGESVDFMLDSIVKGVSRGSPMILDNLGIVVSIGEATQQWARANGKNADSLTKTEKASAVLQATLKAVNPMIKTAEAAGANAAENYQRMSSAIDNLAKSIGENMNPAISTMVDWLTTAADYWSDILSKMKEVQKTSPRYQQLSNEQARVSQILATGLYRSQIGTGANAITNASPFDERVRALSAKESQFVGSAKALSPKLRKALQEYLARVDKEMAGYLQSEAAKKAAAGKGKGGKGDPKKYDDISQDLYDQVYIAVETFKGVNRALGMTLKPGSGLGKGAFPTALKNMEGISPFLGMTGGPAIGAQRGAGASRAQKIALVDYEVKEGVERGVMTAISGGGALDIASAIGSNLHPVLGAGFGAVVGVLQALPQALGQVFESTVGVLISGSGRAGGIRGAFGAAGGAFGAGMMLGGGPTSPLGILLGMVSAGGAFVANIATLSEKFGAFSGLIDKALEPFARLGDQVIRTLVPMVNLFAIFAQGLAVIISPLFQVSGGMEALFNAVKFLSTVMLQGAVVLIDAYNMISGFFGAEAIAQSQREMIMAAIADLTSATYDNLYDPLIEVGADLQDAGRAVSDEFRNLPEIFKRNLALNQAAGGHAGNYGAGMQSTEHTFAATGYPVAAVAAWPTTSN